MLIRSVPIIRSVPNVLSVPMLAVAAAMSLGAPLSAQAQSPSGAPASAYLTGTSFLANPQSLLAMYPFGGGDLVSAVRHLVLDDLGTVNPLLSLATTATVDQKNAIGTGVGLAALSVLSSNPQAASTIQQALARRSDPVVLAAYMAVTGNEHLTGAGPSAGGSPGSAEAPTANTTPSSVAPSLGVPLPTKAQDSSTPAGIDQSVASFLANPGSLLEAYPLGGNNLVSTTRHLVLADLSTVDPLVNLATSATTDQKNAIGTGIGLAALVLLPSNPQAPAIIQLSLSRLNDPIVLAAYAAVTGNQHLTAAGPGGGGGGSPGSAESATGNSSAGGGVAGVSALYPNFDTPNIPDAFTIPGITVGTPVVGPTTVGNSVSPANL